ncbi:phosphate acyltransferase PlsX [Metamycoplasma phocicerebrale]|uniref:Phosphate acyltransferase n=1 Tax=Metamycoplasma phocicerebrale TaxID=142649 RepID=A0A3Q9VBS1_9BACT|nr:phosphate acyltransferase PlsX [Metamycoplasma phocicerebrale]AZZ65606.1 phosphate acyltransferase PlsX [Metamycoplasma phocicerebrale]
MKKIVFDILNNDGGHFKALDAALKFKNENPNYQLTLVGPANIIKEYLKKNTNKFEIFDSNGLAHIENSPREILKNQSTMLDAFNFLNENEYDAILSSGDSGSLISLSSLKVKRLPNVARPAFMPMIPTINNKYILLLDAGANVETPSEYLNNWSLVATEYYKKIFNIQKPTVGLLNIGTEEYKGSNNIKEANHLLKDNTLINYQGFIEPKDAIEGKVDIVLAEGQIGNIFLKTLESSFIGFGRVLKQTIMSSCISKIGGLFLKPKLKKMKQRFDYRNVGGAYIVGLEKVVVKAHGSSDKIAFYNALNQIKNLLEKNNFIEDIKSNLGAINNE